MNHITSIPNSIPNSDIKNTIIVLPLSTHNKPRKCLITTKTPKWIFLGMFLCHLFIANSYAQNRKYEIYFDTDNDSSTGCIISHNNLEDIVGIESKLSINTDENLPTITSTDISNCTGSGFAVASNTPSSLGLNTGANGEDVFESKLLFSDINSIATNKIKVYFATTHNIAEDVVLEKSPGTPIVINRLDSIPIPGLGLMGLLVLSLFIYFISKKKSQKLTSVMIYLLLISPLVWAFIIIIDGQTNDWANIQISASDPVADTSAPGEYSDITNVYAVSQENAIYLRMDIVEVENQILIANDTTVTTLEDKQITIQLTGQSNNNLTFNIEQQPSNGTLSNITTIDNQTSEVIYTPNQDFNGTDNFSFTSNNGQSNSQPATANINITAVNDAPTFIAGSNISVTKDSGFYNQSWATNINKGANNETDQQLGFIITNSNISLFSTQPTLTSDGQISFQPTANGTASINVTLLDDGGTENNGIDTSPTQSFDIIISVNNAPTANDQNLSTNEDTPLSIILTAQDLDGSSLSYILIDQPTNGSLSGTAPKLIYTPALQFNGSDSFTFKANDGQLDSNIATISIAVNLLNDPPVAQSQSLTTNEGELLPIVLQATDPDGDLISYELTSQPTNGQIIGTSANLIYLPSSSFDGTDSFNFIANDGLLDSQNATIDITILDTNDAPVAIPQSLTTQENTTIDITLNGTDPEGDNLTYQLASTPQHGTVSGSGQAISYTPSSFYEGLDSFEFIVNDGEIDSNKATITINTTTTGNNPPFFITQPVTTLDIKDRLIGSPEAGL